MAQFDVAQPAPLEQPVPVIGCATGGTYWLVPALLRNEPWVAKYCQLP